MSDLTSDVLEANELIEPMDGRREIAARHVQSAREYTMTLLEDLTDSEWYWSPQPAVSHIAWQVGHLAFAQYGLMLFRQRGRRPEDQQLMSGKFRKTFAKGTQPSTDRSIYPSPDEILQTLKRVHWQSLRELADRDESTLDEPVDRPWAAFATRFGALMFAGDHEMLHAGQIGMLRRLMSKPPLR